MTTKAQYPSSDRGSATAVYAESPPQGRRFTGRCQEHGDRLEELEDIADLTIERGGMTYRLADPENTVIAYCPECQALSRHRSPDLGDATARELVEKRITENFHGNLGTGRGGFRELFEPASVSVGDGLSNCPFCGTEFDMVNRETGRCICPDHGELTVQIRQHDA